MSTKYSFTMLVLFSIITTTLAQHPNQCLINPDEEKKSLDLVPPVIWNKEGTEYEPALVKLIFDIWDIQRVDDFTQSLSILATFSVLWTDVRLQRFCEYDVHSRSIIPMIKNCLL